MNQIRSNMRTYAGAARRRVHLATVLLLAIAQTDARPVMSIPFRFSTKFNTIRIEHNIHFVGRIYPHLDGYYEVNKEKD